jgi:heat shock protein 1/8
VIQADMKHWPFKVLAREGDKPFIQVQYKGDTKIFAPEEISSMVLSKMKETAEAFLGKIVSDAVITGTCKLLKLIECSSRLFQ